MGGKEAGGGEEEALFLSPRLLLECWSWDCPCGDERGERIGRGSPEDDRFKTMSLLDLAISVASSRGAKRDAKALSKAPPSTFSSSSLSSSALWSNSLLSAALYKAIVLWTLSSSLSPSPLPLDGGTGLLSSALACLCKHDNNRHHEQ